MTARKPRSPQRPARSPPAEPPSEPFGRLGAALFEQPDVGLVAIDRTGAIVRANAATRTLAGPLAELASGAACDGLFAAAERAAVIGEIQACLHGGPVRPVFATRLHGGTSVGVLALALRDAGGAVPGGVLRLTDLSAQRQLETELSHAQRLQAVGQLAGGIAHDFNNLLTVVAGAAETVSRSAGLSPEATEDLATICASAGRGAALVRQLLAFSRPEPLLPRVVALNDVVLELRPLLRRLVGSRIRLDLDLAGPGGQVRADPTQLDQVLVNLAANARDAMPDGGTLTVRTGLLTLHEGQRRGPATIPPWRYVTLEVEDSCVGISPDILPRIFEPFFTTRRQHGGNGIGLATVAAIIRRSAGFIGVESAADRGTVLRVWLPQADGLAIARSEALRPEAATVAAPAAARPGMVLVVDDDEPVRRLAVRALTRAGWQVIAAEGGEQALAVLAAHDLAADPRRELVGVVTDLAMPGMDGVQVLCAVRAQTGRAGLPGLLVSGYAEASQRTATLGQGGVAFLAKPYTLDGLVDALAGLLGGLAAASPPAAPTEGGREEQGTEQSEFSIAPWQVSNI